MIQAAGLEGFDQSGKWRQGPVGLPAEPPAEHSPVRLQVAFIQTGGKPEVVNRLPCRFGHHRRISRMKHQPLLYRIDATYGVTDDMRLATDQLLATCSQGAVL